MNAVIAWHLCFPSWSQMKVSIETMQLVSIIAVTQGAVISPSMDTDLGRR